VIGPVLDFGATPATLGGVTLRILLGKDTAEERPSPQPPAVCEPVPARLPPSRAGHAPADPVATRRGNDFQLGTRWLWVIAAAALLLAAAGSSRADEPEGDAADSSLENTLEAGESSVELPRRSLVRWNEFDWHLSDNVRLELAYGYGTLDRFGLEGTTQFFQSRIQLLF
jgi:hypothetical protein